MIVLDVPFRGDRTYVHGTDIFGELQLCLPDLVSSTDSYLSSIAFHRKATHSVGASLGQPPRRASAIGRFLISTRTEKVEGYISETNEQLSRRIPYNEESILIGSNMDYSRRAISITPHTSYTSIQTIVASMKALCLATITPTQGHWMFGRLDLSRPLPDRIQSLEVELTRVIANKFAVADLQSDDTSLGSIRFIKDVPSGGRGQ